MPSRRHRSPLWLAWGCLLFGMAGCAPQVVGSCTDPDCEPAGCDMADQRLPEQCDAGARTCDGVTVVDEFACSDCLETNRRLNIGQASFTRHVQCACRSCAVQLTACVDSARDDGGDAARDRDCRSIVECSLGSGCSGTECYCGEGVDQITCLANANNGGTMGPCARTIAQAGGCIGDPLQGDCVLQQRYDSNTAIGRAIAVGSCTTGDPVVGIEGHCPFATTGVR